MINTQVNDAISAGFDFCFRDLQMARATLRQPRLAGWFSRIGEKAASLARSAARAPHPALSAGVEVPNITECFEFWLARLALTTELFQLYSTIFSAPVLPLMKIPVDEIPESPKEIQFSESVAELNEIYTKGKDSDFRFPQLVDVDLVYYRSGREIFFRGSFSGQLEGSCSRCLKDFSMPVDHEFEFVLSPDPFGSSGATEELRREELGLSYYSGDEINLAPLIREQVMLALPTRPLCGENCRGLCGGCGADLNYEDCRCSRTAEDPRMAFFRTLRIDR